MIRRLEDWRELCREDDPGRSRALGFRREAAYTSSRGREAFRP